MSAIVPSRPCNKCGVEYPRTTEYFSPANHSSDNLTYTCKICLKEAARQRRLRQGAKPRLRSQTPGHKICSVCLKELPATNEYFYTHKTGQYGLGGKCKECRKQEYEGRKPYYQNYHVAHRDERNNSARERDKKRRSERSASHKKWRHKNPEKWRLIVSRRRSRKLLSVDDLTEEQWTTTLTHFGGCCAVCGKPPGLWHIIVKDHWVPVSLGGATTATNIVPLCHSTQGGIGGCNNEKHNRPALEWLTAKYGKRKGKATFKMIQQFLIGKMS